MQTLHDIGVLPIDGRFRLIVDRWKLALDAVCGGSRRGVLRADPSAADRLAWAVAFNVSGSEDPGGPHDCYRVRMGAEATLETLRLLLVGAGKHSESLLGDLALSVGCEHRGDWQHPAHRGANLSARDAYFNAVYADTAHVVEGYLAGRFPREMVEDLASETWLRVFRAYWAPTARRRFLGLSRISTMVCQVGWNAGVDAMKKRTRRPSVESHDHDGMGLIERLGVEAPPGTRLDRAEVLQAVREALAQLSVQRDLIAEAVLISGIPAVEVAAKLGISEAAVSQNLAKARERIRKHLISKDLNPLD